jgi:putative membrane protein
MTAHGERVTAGRAAARGALSLVLLAGIAAILVMIVPSGLYDWIKAAHVVAIIAWMAGMLYLPRLFVYHVALPAGSEASETFKIMERRLLRAIINPAMMASWSFGLWLAWEGFRFSAGWLHAKLAAVVALSAVHGYLAGAVRRFAEDSNRKSARHWRIVNEIPTLLMIVIVVLVIVKPF